MKERGKVSTAVFFRLEAMVAWVKVIDSAARRDVTQRHATRYASRSLILQSTSFIRDHQQHDCRSNSTSRHGLRQWTGSSPLFKVRPVIIRRYGA